MNTSQRTLGSDRSMWAWQLVRLPKQLISPIALALVLATLLTPSVSADNSSASSAFGVSVSVEFEPFLGAEARVAHGPRPTVFNDDSTSYSNETTVASSNSSLPVIGDIHSTDLIHVAVDGESRSHANASTRVDNASVSVVGNLPLVTLSADIIEANARISGICGSGLNLALGSRIVNGTLSGTMIPDLTIDADVAANTVLLDQAGIRIVANEQLANGNGTLRQSASVNAIHVTLSNVELAGLGVLNGEIIIAHSAAEMLCDPVAPDTADLSLAIVDSPDPSFEGQTLRYTLTISNP